MQTRNPIHNLIIALVLTLSLAGTSFANVQNFGDFSANTVDFNDVTESNLLIDGTTFYYGAPTVSAPSDTLIPAFNNFLAQVNPGPGLAMVESTLGMMIVAKPLQSYDTIYFSEFGDYSITGISEVKVEVPWFIDILEVLDASGTPQAISPLTFNGQSIKTYSAPADDSGIFGIDFQVDMVPALATITLPDGSTPTKVTKVNFRFDNRLTAFAENPNSIAFIKKKQPGGIRITTTVPEPSSMGLGLLGLMGLMRVVRRRK